jgi:anti-sigma-K factor RskA
MAADPHANVASYALDALDPQEEREFEEHLASCEQCREELAQLRETTAELAYGAVGPPPPPHLKLRILEEARAERPNVSSFPARRPWVRPLAAAAALAAAFALGIGVWAATRPAASDPFASVLAKPGAKVMPMDGKAALAIAPDGTAAIAATLPNAPSGKTYETWVIRNGKPERAGLFSGPSTFRLERRVPRGSVVAVTLEPAGGVDAPTTTPLAATEAVS